MKRAALLLINLLLLTLSFETKGEELVYSFRVPKEQEKLLNKDIEVLKNFSFKKDPKKETLSLLGIEDFENKTLTDWLFSRVRYVIHDEPFEDLDIEVSKKSWSYDHPDELPIIEKSHWSTGRGFTVMSNVGTAIYTKGKKSGDLLAFKFKKKLIKKTAVEVKSPRVGIIQIGEGLFKRRLQIDRSVPGAEVNSYGRISTLFHEARHGDGHGKGMGFYHGLCPKGHDFEGLNACDKNLNGPYTVGAHVLKEFLRNCDDCSEYQKERLRLRILDSMSRVIDKLPVIKNENDKKIVALQEQMKVQEVILSFETDNNRVASALEELMLLRSELEILIEKTGGMTIEESPVIDPTPEGL